MKSKLITSILSACVTIMLISGTSINASSEKKASYLDKKGITIEYYGHSSFGISDSDGTKIVTDPYSPDLGYTFPSNVSTKLLTISHDHFDHNYPDALQKYDQLINASTGRFRSGDIKVEGILSYHDQAEGNDRGTNTIYTYEINNIRICHLGDLGHELSQKQIASFGNIDVLMIPVGGFFTLNSDEAVKVVKSIDPKVVIPMHYETDITKVTFEDYLDPVEDFTSKLAGWEVEEIDDLTVTRQMLNTLKSKKVFVLNYN
jgi:L-ascorbate metabolism protein UlaG (beta-lactamase superfamily)